MRDSLTRILSVAMLVGGTTAFLSSRSRLCTRRSAVTQSASVAVFLAEEDTDAERSDTSWSPSNNTALLQRPQRTVEDPWRVYDYVETPSIPSFSPEDVIHITEQIQARSSALQDSNVESANGIRTHLLSDYSVVLHDKNRQWFRAGKNQYVFNATASDVLPELQAGDGGRMFTEQVRTLIQQRTLAREIQDYAQADAVKATLRTTYGVTVKDVEKEWTFAVALWRGNAPPPVPGMVEEETAAPPADEVVSQWTVVQLKARL